MDTGAGLVAESTTQGGKMPIKLLLIDACCDCKYYNFTEKACWHSESPKHNSIDSYDIPAWCPLVDYKEPVVVCEECGCEGNESCGHEPVDPVWLCTLHPDMVCQCCKVKDAENKNNNG